MEEPKRPQKDYFQLVVRLKRWNTRLMYTIFLVSIANPFFNEHHEFYGVQLKLILSTLNFVFMFLFAGLTFIIDYTLFPSSEKIRRCDFIDNSFGSKFNIIPSENYFSNEEISQGIYKAAVNLFENCFFTLNVSRKMQFSKIFTSLIFIIFVIILAVKGFKDNQFAVPVLQLFLSVNILGELIKLLLFVNRNETYFNDLVNLFSHNNFKSEPTKYVPQFLKIYSDYESNLAWGMILLDSKIYNKLNPTLSEEWQKIKIKYTI